jgi:site-specific DNA recombinase
MPLEERSEGRRLLEDAKAGKFDTVLVYKLDRLGRTLLVIVEAHDKLAEIGVALRSPHEAIDTSTPHGRFAFQTLASVAELERENIRTRTRDGLHRAFRAGDTVAASGAGRTGGLPPRFATSSTSVPTPASTR